MKKHILLTLIAILAINISKTFCQNNYCFDSLEIKKIANIIVDYKYQREYIKYSDSLLLYYEYKDKNSEFIIDRFKEDAMLYKGIINTKNDIIANKERELKKEKNKSNIITIVYITCLTVLMLIK